MDVPMHRSLIYLFPHPPIRDRSARLVDEAFGDMYVYDLNNQKRLKIQKRRHRQIQIILIYSTCFAPLKTELRPNLRTQR